MGIISHPLPLRINHRSILLHLTNLVHQLLCNQLRRTKNPRQVTLIQLPRVHLNQKGLLLVGIISHLHLLLINHRSTLLHLINLTHHRLLCNPLLRISNPRPVTLIRLLHVHLKRKSLRLDIIGLLLLLLISQRSIMFLRRRTSLSLHHLLCSPLLPRINSHKLGIHIPHPRVHSNLRNLVIVLNPLLGRRIAQPLLRLIEKQPLLVISIPNRAQWLLVYLML